ncbi:phage tail tape measure protein [Dickeya zeae]|uniref:Phage tail tape measure protein n=1 Tax=Dickeya zeae TaxID=204042 RepID=A0ABX8W0K0_9GAMM|nr:phage tail tape measure protein [Dickeya zeae]QYM92228.1 phage tail tape measure protein [Dickeya zeae]
MKQLDFTLSLIDKLTRPVKQAQAAVTGFAKSSRDAFSKIAVGGAGLIGTAMSIQGALGPAVEMHGAMVEASARGVDDSALQKINANALKFSTQYGRSALEYVQSTARINAAVGTLTKEDLPGVVRASNVMAAALKATADESSEFMGQMFANFRSDAESMGNVQFAEQLASKAAYMRNAFGVELGAIKDLMEGARGVGTNYGIGMDEQLAVMGELQRTLGTEASSAYEGFLSGAVKGAKKLGLSFEDANGKLLTLPAMLEKLRGKYGASIEGNLKAQSDLDDAFGDSAAVIKQLYGNVGVLQRHITELGSSDGMKRATEMAQKMASPWERLTAIWYAIRAAMGATLLPVLYPLINRMADGGQVLVRWLNLFPNITRVIGYCVLAVMSLAAAGALVNIVLGVGRFVLMGLRGLWAGLTAIIRIHIAAIWLYNKAVLAWAATMRILRGVLLAVRMASLLTGMAFNIALWPVLLIIGAVALLVAGCYLLIRHWDGIKNAITQTEMWKTVAENVQWVAEIFSQTWKAIIDGWSRVVNAMGSFSLTETMGKMADGVGEIFSGLWDSVLASFNASYRWIIGKLNAIPGINIAMPESTPRPGGEGLLTGGKIKGIDSGGLQRDISNSNAKNYTDNSRKVENLTIYANKGFTPEQLTEWEALR